MYKIGQKVIYSVTGEDVIIRDVLANGYYMTDKSDNSNSRQLIIHHDMIGVKKFVNDFKNFKYGEGDVFSKKLYMMDVYLFVKFTLGKDFNDIKYINGKQFMVLIDKEHKQFELEITDYDHRFFWWSKDTFKTNSDYIFQIGKDFVRIFSPTLRQVLTSNMFNKDGKMHFSYNEGTKYKTGAIYSNSTNDEFACKLEIVSEYIHDSRIECKTEIDILIEDNIKIENILQDEDGMAKITYVC